MPNFIVSWYAINLLPSELIYLKLLSCILIQVLPFKQLITHSASHTFVFNLFFMTDEDSFSLEDKVFLLWCIWGNQFFKIQAVCHLQMFHYIKVSDEAG